MKTRDGITASKLVSDYAYNKVRLLIWFCSYFWCSNIIWTTSPHNNEMTGVKLVTHLSAAMHMHVSNSVLILIQWATQYTGLPVHIPIADTVYSTLLSVHTCIQCKMYVMPPYLITTDAQKATSALNIKKNCFE